MRRVFKIGQLDLADVGDKSSDDSRHCDTIRQDITESTE